MSGRFHWPTVCAPIFLLSAWVSLSTTARAQSAVSSAPASLLEAQPLASEQSAALDVYTAPKVKNLVRPKCAAPGLAVLPKVCQYMGDSPSDYREGWAQLDFMVDPKGKPYEVSVVNSTGDRIFEEAAIASIQASTFEPASLGGRPVESELALKFVFGGMSAQYSGAKGEFVERYKNFSKAVSAGDSAAADAEMKKFVITNLYEDAYYGLAQYNYAAKWGSRQQQLEGLRRALAYEPRASYLPSSLFASAQQICFDLYVNLGYYREAVELYQARQKYGSKTEGQAHFQTIIEKLDKIQADNTGYKVAGEMPKGEWFIGLFKRHFQVEVLDGAISEVKLRCQKSYVYFPFDPKLQYEVSPKQGQCSLELDGTPGTHFNLGQF